MNSNIRTAAGATLVALAISAAPVTAVSQIPDARVVAKGVLRITFSPLYTNYDSRFARGSMFFADGDEEPLGADFSSPTLGPDIFGRLAAPTGAVRAITGDTTFTFNMGALTTDLDADIRIFPFNFAVGFSDRLTLTAKMPIVTTRMNSFVALDSSGAQAGLNQIATEAGNATARADAALLIADLLAGAMLVDSRVMAGDFGCPNSAQCDAARTTAADARSLAMALGALTGLSDPTNPLPPGAPLASSSAGLAILAEVTRVGDELVALGSAVGGGLQLPSTPIGPDQINTILGGPSFGYDLFPLETTKISRFGDFELGFRYLAVENENLRAVLRGTLRLPTGTLESNASALDISTGDKQTDIETGFEVVYSTSDRLGFSGAASYTLQTSHSRLQRVTRPDDPIAFSADETLVTISPGNILSLQLHPWLRLGEGVRVFASVSYYNKSSDSYSAEGTFTSLSGATVQDLGLESSNKTLSFGGGLAYRSTRNGRGVKQLPIEAGLNYLSAFSGSGGLTPKFNRLNLYLRLYYHIF